MSHKKKVIQQGIEEQDAYYQGKVAEEEAERERKRDDALKPNLLKRFLSILIDGIIIALLSGGLYCLSYFVIFPNIGYTELTHRISQAYADTGLYYINSSGGAESIVDHYDSSKSPKENFDDPITYYYTVDARAIEAGKMQEYNAAKLSSGRFESTAEGIVEKSGFTTADFKEFYVAEYEEAVAFQEKDPSIILASNQTLLYQVVNLACVTLLSTSIAYLLLPLVLPHGSSLGQLICGISLGQLEDGTPARKGQIVGRYFVVYVIDYLLPISLYILMPALFGLPLFVTSGMIAFSKKNVSFQDFFSKTRTRRKIPMDPFAGIEAIKGQAH